MQRDKFSDICVFDSSLLSVGSNNSSPMDLTWSLSYIVFSLIVGWFMHWYLTKNYFYWKNIGIPYVPAVPILGSFVDVIFSIITSNSLLDLEVKRCKKYGKIFGSYEGRKAILNLVDPDLLRNVLVKDFHVFTNRRVFQIGNDIADKMVSILVDEDWKRVRTLMTPAFSTGKIKKMVEIILDSAKILGENFASQAKSEKPVDVKRLFGTFTMDVIASSAFAVKINSHHDPDNEFVANARSFFNKTFNWRFAMLILCPGIMKRLGISAFSPGPFKFFEEVTLQIIEERRKTGQKRNDFLQMMMEAADRSPSSETIKETEADQEDERAAKEYGHEEEETDQLFRKLYRDKSLSSTEQVAQCVLFFLGGYENIASTLSFVVYQLALNPDIQEKLISEVDNVIAKNEGKLTYECVQEMNYLDRVISETLRYFPSAIRIERKAEEDYKLGDTGITIPKDFLVQIPVYAMHHDPEIYPDPEKFDPDRFTPEQKANRHPYTYLPFGAGPRNCLGMRFTLMEIKICLSYIVSQFRFKRCPETKVPPEYYFGQGILSPKEIALKIEARNDKVLQV